MVRGLCAFNTSSHCIPIHTSIKVSSSIEVQKKWLFLSDFRTVPYIFMHLLNLWQSTRVMSSSTMRVHSSWTGAEYKYTDGLNLEHLLPLIIYLYTFSLFKLVTIWVTLSEFAACIIYVALWERLSLFSNSFLIMKEIKRLADKHWNLHQHIYCFKFCWKPLSRTKPISGPSQQWPQCLFRWNCWLWKDFCCQEIIAGSFSEKTALCLYVCNWYWMYSLWGVLCQDDTLLCWYRTVPWY